MRLGRELCSGGEKEDEAGGWPPGLQKGRSLWESPHHLGAWFTVTCLPGDEGRNRKERADVTGKSSWTGDSSWLSLPLRPKRGLPLPLHHRQAPRVPEPRPGLLLPPGWELLSTESGSL